MLKNNKMILLIVLAVALLIVMLMLRREKKEVKVPEAEKQRVSAPSRRLPPMPTFKDMDFEEEKVVEHLTVEEIRQIQMKELKQKVQRKDPSSRPGKYPTSEELEELEKSGAVLY